MTKKSQSRLLAVGILTLLLAWKLWPTESHSAKLELTPPGPSAVAEATFSSLASKPEGNGPQAGIQSRPIAADDCRETSSSKPTVAQEPVWVGGSVTDPDDNLPPAEPTPMGTKFGAVA